MFVMSFLAGLQDIPRFCFGNGKSKRASGMSSTAHNYYIMMYVVHFYLLICNLLVKVCSMYLS